MAAGRPVPAGAWSGMSLDKSEQIRAMLAPAVQALGFELWGVEHHSESTPVLLRIYIDHPDGITVDDCSAVSDQVSAVLDVEEPIRGEYTLEVSSPGIERPLFTPEQFRQYAGSEVKVRLAWPEHGRRNFRGRLLSVSDSGIEVEVDGAAYALPFGAIAKARLLEPTEPSR
jgi:ribosome maturation factor RimP